MLDLQLIHCINTIEQSNGYSDPVTLEHRDLEKPGSAMEPRPCTLRLTHFMMLKKGHKNTKCSGIQL